MRNNKKFYFKCSYFNGYFVFQGSLIAFCIPIRTNMENHTDNISEKEDDLEDFEEFDLRDAINVGAYSVMSAG